MKYNVYYIDEIPTYETKTVFIGYKEVEDKFWGELHGEYLWSYKKVPDYRKITISTIKYEWKSKEVDIDSSERDGIDYGRDQLYRRYVRLLYEQQLRDEEVIAREIEHIKNFEM